MNCPEYKLILTESRLITTRCWGFGEWGVIAGVHGISFWGNKNVLELDGGMVAQHCEYNKNHCIAHFKVGTITNFMLSVLLHN